MAFGCVMWLKSECDGCGACQEPGALSYNRRRSPSYCTDLDSLIEPSWEDEEEEEEEYNW